MNQSQPSDFKGCNALKVGYFSFFAVTYHLQGTIDNCLPTEVPTRELTKTHKQVLNNPLRTMVAYVRQGNTVYAEIFAV